MLLMIVVSGAAIYSSGRLVRAYEGSARSHQALLQLDRYFSSLKDVETGARGYALTHDRKFLDSYDEGRRSFRVSATELKRLASTEPVLRSNIGPLGIIAQQRLTAAEETIRRAAADDSAGTLESARRGREVMGALRVKIAALRRAQSEAYERRAAVVGWQAILANLALAAGIAVGLLTLSWLFRLLKRQVARRRGAEEDLRRLNAELEERVSARTAEVEESRRMLTAVIENIPDTVFLKDPSNDFRYVLVNKSCEKLTGHHRDEFIGHVDHELFPADIAATRREDDIRVVEGGESVFIPSRLLPTDHGTRTIETSKLPVQLGLDGNTYVLGIVRDLTDQRQLETQVREMQRLESVGRLTGGIAHDFNNLLAIILGSLELIREDLPEGSESANISDEAIDAVDRGAELVRRLLAFARKQHLEPTAVDLNVRLPAIVSMLQRTLGERIRVKVEPADDLWHAQIDPTQVDDALVNLAINARDAMPHGGNLVIETANVVLDDDYASHHADVEPGEYVMLAVSDNGAGMSSETIARAFEPFYTTKAEGRGTGLGLSQVYGWVKQSGGHIKIYSEIDYGTTIKLYLPRATTGEKASQTRLTHTAEAKGHERILLVEDNPNVRRTVVRQLAQLGYTVIEAADGEAALAQVADGLEFDLLLTDVVMPGGMNGYDLAEEIGRLRPKTPILFTSGYTELAENSRDLPRRGSLLSKPYSRQSLGQAIRAALV